jgi:sporulation protein YlmC with PRC-barrel domain
MSRSFGQGCRASKLMGKSVVNEKNEKIGRLDDLVIARDKSYGAQAVHKCEVEIAKTQDDVPVRSLS